AAASYAAPRSTGRCLKWAKQWKAGSLGAIIMVTSTSGPQMAEQRKGPAQAATADEQRLLDNWLTIQGINLTRHAMSLRPFTKDEFGTGPATPSEAHIKAVNRFIDSLRVKLDEMVRWVGAAASMARREPTGERLRGLLERKQTAS